MIFFIFLHSIFSTNEDTLFKPIRLLFPDEKLTQQQTNTSQHDSLNQTLINDIKQMIKQVNETLNSLKDGSHNINESLQYLAEQVESITNSSDIEVLFQVINQFEQFTSNYTSEVDRIVSDIVNKKINELLVFKEIIVNYVPKSNLGFIRRSEIKPVTKPINQISIFPNFTFETLRPYACRKIVFDNFSDAGNSSVIEANLLFFLKGRLYISPVKCHILIKKPTTVKLPNPVLFDKFIIQSLRTLGESNNFTLPTFHLYEPGRIKN
ncbi:hypothetical protein M9Y10_025480 [Tritrichomonas musculus]|uniref:SUN domain-containing protein n=1 Tax=Tritrichomonas musculus TaxID=1915356 RepID=A0ABR2H8X1_9EUKA